MTNKLELKKERSREIQDTDLCGSVICLRLHECDYILLLNDLGL
jgi:hypothetical protein